jgi:hypothetical protein
MAFGSQMGRLADRTGDLLARRVTLATGKHVGLFRS